MKLWAGVTDNNWYKFLSEGNFDEVNFWQPSGRAPFADLPAGMHCCKCRAMPTTRPILIL